MATDGLLGLYTLKGLIGRAAFTAPIIKSPSQSFKVEETANLDYILPDLKCEMGCVKAEHMPKVILISAAGATGKTELTRYLSTKLNMPVFNLAMHPPVASSSLTGLFYESLGPAGLASYVLDLQEGRSCLMIDALDEGSLKTTAAGFNSFLDGIAQIAKESSGTPFVLLGRTNVIDHCWAYLEDNNVSTAVLRIQPFTLPQARAFIDKKIDYSQYTEQYQQVREYILESVNGIFKNRKEVSEKSSNAFIGYAPVLQAIVVLLKVKPNFKALYEELQSKKDRGIDLIIHIVEEIMRREREEKIWPILKDSILVGRTEQFVTDFKQAAYSNEEQCVRILSHLMGVKPHLVYTEDPVFNQNYQERIGDWLKEHPFLQDNRMQSSVFECYILAKLMMIEKYQDLVSMYLQTTYKDAFMLFFIFDKLSAEQSKMEHLFLPYLYASFKSLDESKEPHWLELDVTGEEMTDNGPIHCEVDFVNGGQTERRYIYKMLMMSDETLTFANTISNLNINAPIRVALDSKRITLTPPVSIICKKLTINVDEFVVEGGKLDCEILLEAEELTIDYSAQRSPNLIDYSNKSVKLSIVTDSAPQHPFIEFYSNSMAVQKLDQGMMDKYNRLRMIIMLFRSHSKGGLAKYRGKIEHKRVLKNQIGVQVLDQLIDKGILLLRDPMYYLDQEAVHEYLGISYQNLRRKQVTPKVVEFLKSIEVLSEVQL